MSSVKIYELDILKGELVADFVETTMPDVIVNLAGATSVAYSFQDPSSAITSIQVATCNFLEAIKKTGGIVRYFNAASSECFGECASAAVETTRMEPLSPYAVAKCGAVNLTKIYRQAFGLFASNGYLSNHESPLRSDGFVTKKIVNGMHEIADGRLDYLELGDISIVRDWGWAPEYAQAIRLIMTSDVSSDYIVATGESHSLEEFAKRCASLLSIDFDRHVKVDESIRRPLELHNSILSPKKISLELGWRPKVLFESIVTKLVDDKLF